MSSVRKPDAIQDFAKKENGCPAIFDPVKGIIDSHIKTKEFYHCCDRHSGLCAIAMDKDETLLFTGGGSDGFVLMWDFHRGAFLRSFDHGFSVEALTITRDAKFLFVAGRGNSIYKWDIENGRLICSFNGNESGVSSLAITQDEKYLLSASGDKINIWEIESQNCIATLAGHKNVVTSIATTPDGNEIISGSEDHTIKVWDRKNWKCRMTLTGHKKGVVSVTVPLNGIWIVSASGDQTIKIWCMKSGECLKTFYHNDNMVRSIAVDKDLRYLVSGGWPGPNLWDLASEKKVRTLGPYASKVYLEKNEKFVISCSSIDDDLIYSRLVRRTNIDTGDSKAIIRNQGGYVSSMAISPCGRVLAAANGVSKGISIWNLEKGIISCVRNGPKDMVSSMVFSLDGEHLISGGFDNDVRIFGVKSFQCEHRLSGHGWCVQSVAISRDQKYVASASWDHTVRIWDFTKGHSFHTFRGYLNDVIFVAFSPD
ncbi:MAG: WD40 repeat domain-containing protein, partial [Oligoflexales bacterium]|nr:WD40 repeat domain-containing protein [Oligoflexales bacterium]